MGIIESAIMGIIESMRTGEEPSPEEKELNSFFYREIGKGFVQGAVIGSCIPLIQSIRNPPSTKNDIFRVLRASALTAPRVAFPLAAYSAACVLMPDNEELIVDIDAPYVPANGVRRFLFNTGSGYTIAGFAGTVYGLVRGIWNPIQRKNMLVGMGRMGNRFGIGGAIFLGSATAFFEVSAFNYHRDWMVPDLWPDTTPKPPPMKDDEPYADTANILE